MEGIIGQNLTFYKADILDKEALTEIFNKVKFLNIHVFFKKYIQYLNINY